MLTEVQKQLERAFPTRKLMFPVTTTLEIRQELKAATVSIGWIPWNPGILDIHGYFKVIQRAYRAWKERVTKNKLNQFSIPVQSSGGSSMPEAAPFYEMNHENPRNPVDDLYDRDENIRNGVPGPSL